MLHKLKIWSVKTLMLCFIFLPFILVMSHGYSQTPAGKDTKTEKKGLEGPLDNNNGEAFLIVCEAKPGQAIVLDPSGKWVAAAKEIEIKFEIGHTPTLTCLIYEGILRPTKPVTKTWLLAQMKTVSAADFQQMIDTLQSDPNAIKAALKKAE